MMGLFCWKIWLSSVWWSTWDSALKGTKLTDVVCQGNVHPHFRSFFHSSHDVRSPRHFSFLNPEIHNNVLVTFFSHNSFPPSVVEQVMCWLKGDNSEEGKAGVMHAAEPVNKSWLSKLVVKNKSASTLIDSLASRSALHVVLEEDTMWDPAKRELKTASWKSHQIRWCGPLNRSCIGSNFEFPLIVKDRACGSFPF